MSDRTSNISDLDPNIHPLQCVPTRRMYFKYWWPEIIAPFFLACFLPVSPLKLSWLSGTVSRPERLALRALKYPMRKDWLRLALSLFPSAYPPGDTTSPRSTLLLPTYSSSQPHHSSLHILSSCFETTTASIP